MTVRDLVAHYLDWVARNRCAATLKSYRGRLKSFVQTFADREIDSLRPLEIDAWLAVADKRPDGTDWRPDTCRQNRCVFKSLQKWALDRRELREPIVVRFEMPRSVQRERIPDVRELKLILRKASPQFSLIYRGLLRSGARPGELARARVEHITVTDSGLRVIVLADHKTARKTGRKRKIPLGKKLGRIVDSALAGRVPGTAGGPIFLNQKGTAWTPSNLSRTFRHIRETLQLDRNLVLYSARHYRGTHTARKKGIFAASKVLGHSQISTTQRYAHETDDDVAAWQDAG